MAINKERLKLNCTKIKTCFMLGNEVDLLSEPSRQRMEGTVIDLCQGIHLKFN